MNADPLISWAEANQRQLMNALGEVRRILEGSIDGTSPTGIDGTAAPGAEMPGGVSETGPRSALDAVCAAFQLSRFERSVLLLCAGPDLDARFGAVLAQTQPGAQRVSPTFGLALAVLPDAHWSALLPTSPLRRWRLIELGGGESLTRCPLRLDEWMLHVLTGTPHLDERLQALVRPVSILASASPGQQRIAEDIARRYQAFHPEQAFPVPQLCGDSIDDQLAVATHVSGLLGCRPWKLSGLDVPTAAADRETLGRLWEREAILSGGILLLDVRDVEQTDSARSALTLLEGVRGIVMLLCREPVRHLNRPTWRIDMPRSTTLEQQSLWHEALGPRAVALNGHLEAVAGQFSLSAQEIREIATFLETRPTFAPEQLWLECRSRTRSRLELLAQQIEPAATWDDLVLPDAQLRTLREMAVHIRQRFRVYEQWGFASKGARGLGISALFAGPSGTGKTMAAEVLAQELRLDLFRIDLSAVVNKYIGETEKNLSRVFDAAESGGAILLFDEADALFGKRSEVKDSHDRYANIQVGYLLQRMETYRGLAILTTNFKQALDNAFLRRLRFVVQFPFPDAGQRAEIWRRVFPAATPTEGLQPANLARLNVAGGNIRNIALQAAFLASDAGQPVRMCHLLQAARSECAKLERPPSDAELGGWI